MTILYHVIYIIFKSKNELNYHLKVVPTHFHSNKLLLKKKKYIIIFF